MIDKKIISYGLLLLAVLLVGSMTLSVGQAQAHYLNSKVWNTVVEAEGATVTSNCLADVADAPLTVLLGEIPGGIIPFTLNSTRDVVGCLEWSVDQADYLDVTMAIGEEPLESGSEFTLEKGEPRQVLMTLEGTKDPHEAMDVNVTVTWSGGLRGTFCLTLPEVAEVDIPDERQQNEDETGSLEEPEPSAEPEPSTEPDLEQEPLLPSDPLPANPEVPKQTIQLSTISSFAPAEGLPVKLTLSEGITQVLLGEGDSEIQPFPTQMCYSLDNGNSYCMLYYGGMLSVAPEDGTTVSVLLDYSRVEGIDPEGEIHLIAEAYENDTLIDSVSASTKPDVAAIYQMESYLLTQEAPLEIGLPEVWKDCQLESTVELLSAGEADAAERPDAVEHVDTVWNPQSLKPDCVSDEEGYRLILKLDESHPIAGTYRLTINWTYEEICFAQAEITFFINYSQYAESVSTGGAGQ